MNVSRTRLWMALASLLATFVSPLAASAQPTDAGSHKAFIILDGSGSMWGKIDGDFKIRMAKRAVGDLLESLDPRIQLGLIAYGNTRKNDCSDISTLISLDDSDREHFGEVVKSIVPRGKTPLTDAIELAAQQLDYTHEPGDIILLSDGVETCDRDPCALARKLADKGVGLRIHVIAFDLSAEEQKSLSCLSSTTGGAFLPASDAGSLKDALRFAVKQVAELPPPPPRREQPATPKSIDIADQSGLRASRFVPAGWTFDVRWEGPGGRNDYVTIVPLDSADRARENYGYTSLGNPLQVIAAIDPGEYELRYIVPQPHAVLARRRITVVESGASVLAPEYTSAGAMIPVHWVGPADRGDIITIVPAGASAHAHGQYERPWGIAGPVALRAPGATGAYEIRYVSGQQGRILASVPIDVRGPGASLAAPPSVVAGYDFNVGWSGPGYEGDYITIVKPDAPERSHREFVYTRGLKEPARLRAPLEPGEYEVRYALGGVHDVLARVPVSVIAKD